MGEDLRNAILLELDRSESDSPSTIPTDKELAETLEVEDLREIQRNLKIMEARGLVQLHGAKNGPTCAKITNGGLDVAEQLRQSTKTESSLPAVLAQLAGLRRILGDIVSPDHRHYRADFVMEYFERYAALLGRLKDCAPIFLDVPERDLPIPSGSDELVPGRHLEKLVLDLDYVFEVRAHEKAEASYPVGCQ